LIKSIFDKHSIECDFLGLEGHPKHLKLCNLRKEYSNADNVKFVWANVEDKLDLKDNQADIIYCSEVLEHMPNPKGFLNDIKRVLKPNGYLVLTTPNEPNVFQKAYWLPHKRAQFDKHVDYLRENPDKQVINNQEVCVYDHISCKTIDEWERILGELNFSLIDFCRGAMINGGPKLHDRPIFLGLRMILEEALDAMPRRLVRNFSSQLIGLYKLAK
jgi:SAM-dependent methyltransferase